MHLVDSLRQRESIQCPLEFGESAGMQARLGDACVIDCYSRKCICAFTSKLPTKHGRRADVRERLVLVRLFTPRFCAGRTWLALDNNALSHKQGVCTTRKLQESVTFHLCKDCAGDSKHGSKETQCLYTAAPAAREPQQTSQARKRRVFLGQEIQTRQKHACHGSLCQVHKVASHVGCLLRALSDRRHTRKALCLLDSRRGTRFGMGTR